MSSKDKYCSVMIWSVFIILLYLFQPKYCQGIYTIITQSHPLFRGQTLVSPRQIFELGFFSPQNSSNQYLGIWYKGVSPQTVVWVANRENPINVTDSEVSLTIGSRGNLELSNRGKNDTIWSTNSKSLSNASTVSATLLDSGNFVLNDSESGDQLWQSFDNPADVFLPGSMIGFNVKTGDKFSLASWKTENDPSPGKFSLEISSQKPPEAFILINGTVPYWRSGPWDRSKFTGIPGMDVGYQSPFIVVENIAKGTTFVNFNVYNESLTLYAVLSLEGGLKLMVRDEGNSKWLVNWEVPDGPCSVYGVCGPFGFCSSFKSPICKCLKGFVPKSNREWSLGNWAEGCVRRKELFCLKNISSSNSSSKIDERDRFRKISNVKPPDFYEFVDVDNTDHDACEKLCIDNCSCLAYANIQGIGCLVWSQGLIDIQRFSLGGQEIFVRLARGELGGGHRNKKIMISLLVIFSIGIIGAIIFGLLKRRGTLKTGNVMEAVEHNSVTEPQDGPRSDASQASKHDPAELPVFEFEAILVATNHFNLTNKLGQGGFGSVYKGSMLDGTEIAVKRLSSSSGQGIEEFKNEMKLISKLQHRNLVRLLGYCVENEEKLLVYEFMPNKSLDCFIFDQRRRAQLDWASRWNIIHGIARGLVYLHRDSFLRVIHRDLKLSNILLDEKMNPKISDFGLARIFHETRDLANTQRVVGTLGYMSPEYAMSGIFSEKSDVFSFGVLVLEIVSGKKNSNFHYRDQHLSLIAYAWHFWSENEMESNLVDEALAGSYSPQEVVKSVHVGLLCTQDYAEDRPSMLDVVLMLSNETNRPEPKRPLFALQSLPRCDFSDTKFSVNETTMSLVEGR